MPNNEATTFIIDTAQLLPFSLRLIVGNGEKGEVIPLTHLCCSLRHIEICIYDVQELKPLRLQLSGEAEPVLFVWNKVYEGRKEGQEGTYELSRKQPAALLYEHGKTDYAYPWRCGLYHFEVQVGEETYYGAFRITPKNFQDEGLSLIQQTVEKVMGSLIMDRGHYKKTFSTFADLEDHPCMEAIRALSKQASRILRLYAEVLRGEAREVIYERGRQYRKQSPYTLRKNMKLEAREAQLHYNRYYQDTSVRLRYIQQETRSFLYELLQLVRFLGNTIEKIEHMQESSKAEKQAVQSILQTIERNGSVTDRDKQKYRNILPLKDTDVKKAAVKLREYKVMQSILQGFRQRMESLYRQREPGEELQLAPPASLRPQEREYVRLLKSGEPNAGQTSKPTFLLVHKPTFLLYEYYMYFAVIEAMQELGFRAAPSVAEQIQTHFYLDGLQDGTTIVLVKGDIQLRIAFNELIETHPLIALSKGSNFYNGEDTKKPDIRLDCYRCTEGGEVYQSSVIIEVKYSPMYNIFQPVGNTKATEQMYKYWSIKHVREQDGRRQFHRRAIYEVICVYPGSQMHPRRIDTGCGIFLQFYPYLTKQGQEQVVGKRELQRIMREWLALED
ncbi:hypothetical protein [Ectobacillus ponti]|uniref:DUF2357 domain-containing protein n=1 Tax=Ectobacillus ponti TaxID=2961894 RepID=A0AA41X5D8_9BACI|nr:hypothetical protein [Ectobacillus ponti]MCP8969231.1 hypothetical protein [Ectobacillus ponti]